MDGSGLSVHSGRNLQSLRHLQCRVSVDDSHLQQHFRCIDLLDHFPDRGTNLWKHSRALVRLDLGRFSVSDLMAGTGCVGGELFYVPAYTRPVDGDTHCGRNLDETTALDLLWPALGTDRSD